MSAPLRTRLISLLLVLVTIGVYARVAGHEFVNYDVDLYILENPNVRDGLSWEGLRWAFTSGYAANWHPLTWLSHMLDCELYGIEPAGHHLTNVVLHALAALLLFRFLLAATQEMWPSFGAAALFALHPTHVESVAWAAERKDVLAGLFWTATLCLYLDYARRPGRGRYWLVLGSLGLGLLSKPIVVTLPFVLLLLDYWPLARIRERSLRGLFLEKVPMIALCVAASAVTWYVQSGAGAARSVDALSITTRLANAAASYAEYLRQTVWPSGLACFYPHPAFMPGDLSGSLYLPAVIGLVVLVAISLLALARRSRSPYLIVGWLWYLGTLVPVIGLVQVGHQAHADRYTYLPSIGLFLMLCWATLELVEHRPRWRPLLSGIGIAALVVLTTVTWRQIGFWKDSPTLHRRALAVTRDNFLAHYHLGVTLARAGELAEARAHFEKTLEIRPTYYLAHQSLAEVFEQEGALPRSELHLRALLRFLPRDAVANFRLARILGLQAKDREAEELYRAVLALDPGYAEAHLSLGLLAGGRGDLTRAKQHFEDALRARPRYADAHLNLGVVYANQNQRELAAKEFRKALAIDPELTAARDNLRALGQ